MGIRFSKATEHYNHGERKETALLHRNIREPLHRYVRAYGNTITMDNGEKIFDASGGAGVASIGYNNKRVKKAISRQLDSGAYACSLTFDTEVAEEFA